MSGFPRFTGALRLLRGDELLGTLTLAGVDQPFFDARFEAAPAFAEVAPVLNVPGDEFDEDAWGAAYERVEALGLRLVTEDGAEIAEFLLHVDGEKAWFRC